MRAFLFLSILFLVSCKDPAKEITPISTTSEDTLSRIDTTTSYTAAEDTQADAPKPKILKKPRGIFQTTIPYLGEQKIQQTVAFYNDLTYQLEEKYKGQKKDSIVITQGTWTPSDDYIWLYKDQIVRARYTWQGNVLQYYSPLVKKSIAMHALKDANEDTVWSHKKNQGIVLYGVGNEPFWNIEITNKDTVSFRLADWPEPLKLKVDSFATSKDSVFYTAQKDTIQLKLTVLPYFCSDGMSDFVYRNKIRVEYNNKLFNGCGMAIKR